VVSEDYAESAISAAQALSATTPIEPHPTPDNSLNRAYHDKHASPDLRLGDDVATYESMMISGQRYLCSIPRIPPEESTTSAANQTSPEEEEKELARATTRGWELIKGMEDNCLYFFSGWWSYSFCHGEGVRQFHQLPPGRNVPMYPPVEDKSVHAFVLGRFEDENKEGKTPQKTLDGSSENKKQGLKEEGFDDGKEMREKGLARLETKGEVRYLVQKLKGGTTCDLTGKERRIEVQVCRSDCLILLRC
jgi:protein OS-9